jgi:alpha-methylacyl-CoA racemase
MPAPLTGLRVVELAGIGPGPHAAMMLADQGAEVIRVQRQIATFEGSFGHMLRGRTIVAADLKRAIDHELVMSLVERADVLIEGYRPGVAERLGLGPLECQRRNARLVYARVTGWGQTGPYAAMAGHDVNYLSVTGVLHAIGVSDRPIPPLNLAGDFGGGSMVVVNGILSALWARESTGLGDVIDAAMMDGAAQLAQHIFEMRAMGMWNDSREANLLDGGAPFYRCYKCSDAEFVAVGAIEDAFYQQLLNGLGINAEDLPPRSSPSSWPELNRRFEAAFVERSRSDWGTVFDGTDACVTPVLSFAEAPHHPQMAARATLTYVNDFASAAAAPRFSVSTAGGSSPTVVWDLQRAADAWAQS